MANHFSAAAHSMFQFVHAMDTSVADKTKRILATGGSNLGKGQIDSENIEWLQHVGFASRPPLAVTGKESASMLVLRLGNTELAIASFDERGLSMYGDLRPGEVCMYAPGKDGLGQARILLKDDGSINLYTKVGNAEGGKGMLLQLDAANDTIRILNSKGFGLVIDPDGVKLAAGGAGGCLTLDKGGKCSLVAVGQCQIDGSSVLLGGIAAPVVNSVCVGPAGLVAVASTKVFAALA